MRAADTASPWARRGGWSGEVASPAELLDKHAVPLTQSLGIDKCKEFCMVILILDTNTLLEDPRFIFDFDFLPQCRVVVLKSVIDELDNLKSSEGAIAYQAREVSRFLENLLVSSPKSDEGWQISEECVLVIDERTEHELSVGERNGSFDDRILGCAERYVERYSEVEGTEVWLVTLDRNMRIRAEAREVPWINPSAWIPVSQNTYVLPMGTLGMRWNSEGNGVRLPVDLGEEGEGRVEVWPFWGYPSGAFSTVHFRLFGASDSPGSKGEGASPVLIVSAENKIRYAQRMKTTPYIVMYPPVNTVGVVYYKKWKLEVRVRRYAIEKAIRVSEYAKRRATADLFQGVSRWGRDSITAGALIGNAIRTLSAEAKSSLVFRQLSLTMRVSRATLEDLKEIQKFEQERQQKYMEAQRRRKKQNRIAWIVVGTVVLGYLLCFLTFFLLVFFHS